MCNKMLRLNSNTFNDVRGCASFVMEIRRIHSFRINSNAQCIPKKIKNNIALRKSSNMMFRLLCIKYINNNMCISKDFLMELHVLCTFDKVDAFHQNIPIIT